MFEAGYKKILSILLVCHETTEEINMNLRQNTHVTSITSSALSDTPSAIWNDLQVQSTGEPLNEKYLEVIAEICRNALSEYSRLICFDFYLRLPPISKIDDALAVSAFLDVLIQQFHADLQKRESNGGRHFHCRIRYLWMKMPEGSRDDYRVLLLLNRDAYFALGKKFYPASPMIDRICDAWMKVTGCDAWQIAMLVHLPKEGCWQFSHTSNSLVQYYEKLFYRASAYALGGMNNLVRSRM